MRWEQFKIDDSSLAADTERTRARMREMGLPKTLAEMQQHGLSMQAAWQFIRDAFEVTHTEFVKEWNSATQS